MWVIVNRTTKTVAGTSRGMDPAAYWNTDLFEVFEWDGVEPEENTPDPRVSMTWADVRIKRNRLLRECDWVLIEDSPKSSNEKKLWKTYRQALRDLPQASGKPADIVWPKKPEE